MRQKYPVANHVQMEKEIRNINNRTEFGALEKEKDHFTIYGKLFFFKFLPRKLPRHLTHIISHYL